MNNTINYSRTIQEPLACDPDPDRLRERFMSEIDYFNVPIIGHYDLDKVNKDNLSEYEHRVLYYSFFSMLIISIAWLFKQWMNDNEEERREAREAHQD